MTADETRAKVLRVRMTADELAAVKADAAAARRDVSDYVRLLIEDARAARGKAKR